ncbi:MAG: alpha/beta hydrolase [Nitrospirota bacterium]|nr:alpha/beta hydrolase [Nitrospirota bacterium]
MKLAAVDPISIVLTVAGAYAALLLLVFVFQSRLLYFPVKTIEATPAEAGLAFEPVRIATEDGVELDGWFVPANKPRGVLLFFHGNAGNISHRLDSLRIFNKLDLSVLIFDYRGYGRSGGSPSEEGTYKDAEAAWRYLAEQRHIPAEKMVYFGRSLGSSIAAWLAVRHPPRALIVESGFTSVPDLAAELYPFLPVRSLSRFDYPTAEYLRNVECPVMVVHSSDDEIIPFDHGRRLHDAARRPKQFLEIKGGHNEGFLLSGATYIDGLRDFLDEYLPAIADGIS